MPRKTEAERAEALRQQKAKIERKLATIEASQRKRSRAEDTRRKVLAGAALLESVKGKPDKEAELRALLDGFLTRPDDRALFGLPVKGAGG
jgi:hypothetical protein